MWLGIIIDIIFVVLLGLAAYKGYKDGAVKVVLDIVVIILVIFIVYITYKPVTKFVMENTNIHSNIERTIYDMLNDRNVNEKGKIEDTENMPFIVNKVNALINDVKEEHYTNLSEKVAKEITTFVMQACVFLAWFIVLYILLTLAKMALVKFVDIIPFVNMINYLAGSILQVGKVLLLTFILIFLLQFILPIVKTDVIKNSIDRTTIVKYLYNNNPVNSFVK